jgi:hypothetical protein
LSCPRGQGAEYETRKAPTKTEESLGDLRPKPITWRKSPDTTCVERALKIGKRNEFSA